MYIMISLSTGIIIVINMILNAKESQKVGSINAIFINYIMAMLVSLLLWVIMLGIQPSYRLSENVPIPYFLGGLLGVLTTYLFNIIVPKVSAFYVVLLRFIGQMLISAFLDYLFFHIFSKGKIFGTILFLIGLMINASIDHKYKIKEKQIEEVIQLDSLNE